MSKITTLQGETIFQTLELDESSNRERLTKEELSSISTSMSKDALEAKAAQEKQSEEIMNSAKKWLPFLVAGLTIFALMDDETKE